MSLIKRKLLAASLIASVVMGTSSASLAGAVPPPMKRTIYIAAIESKGSARVGKEPFPKTPLPAGGGYRLKEPNKDGKWEVETYAWLPGSLTVYQGDEVTLKVVGINGAEHVVTIEGYDLKYVVKRGEITTVSFKAQKAGIFEIICHLHGPSMTGQLIVLPRSQN